MSLTKLAQLNSSLNIAKDLDDLELIKIGSQVVNEFKLDLRSRAGWENELQEIMKIAKQIHETKNYPYPNSSNVKLPLITNASIQFAARNLPEIIQSDKVVRFSILGDDPNNYYKSISDAIEKHMSYQLLIESNQWEIMIDKLLHVLPIVGLAYTKVYYDPIKLTNCVDLCTPECIVVNDNVKSLEQARRISHVIYLHKNDIISGINKGIYNDILDDLGDPTTGSILEINPTQQGQDPDGLHEFIEQHRYWDLDGDGYQEPYVITVEAKTQKVLRIYSRWDMDKVIVENKSLVHIEPVQYFTDWHFIPSPDGKFHSVGFGQLLYPLNSAANTAANQLIDAGRISNLQGGIIGRGVRIKGGVLRPRMGEFLVADSADGTSLKDNIVNWPTKEPSNVLFQMLGMMTQYAEKLSAVTDVMTGQQQAQNAAATTVLALEEQGLKVFTGIQKRIFRSLKCDLKKLFRLNRLYFKLPSQVPITINNTPLSQNDYILAERFNICPVFDPDLASDVKRLMKAQSIIQIVTQGLITGPGAMEAVTYYLQQLRIPDSQIAKLVQPPPPAPPTPEQQKIALDGQRDHVLAQIEAGKLQLEQQKLVLEGLTRSAKAKELEAKAAMEFEKAKHSINLEKVKLAADTLTKVNPEKGVTIQHVQPILDKLTKE